MACSLHLTEMISGDVSVERDSSARAGQILDILRNGGKLKMKKLMELINKIRHSFKLGRNAELYRAVYLDNLGSGYVYRKDIDENIIGYFSSEEQFKKAVRERWPNNYRNTPIFRRYDNGELGVNFGTDGVITSSHSIILRKIEPTGFYYEST